MAFVSLEPRDRAHDLQGNFERGALNTVDGPPPPRIAARAALALSPRYWAGSTGSDHGRRRSRHELGCGDKRIPGSGGASMVNGDRPTLGPNAGRKARKTVRHALGAASDALGLARCTGRAQTRPSTTGIWEMSVHSMNLRLTPSAVSAGFKQ